MKFENINPVIVFFGVMLILFILSIIIVVPSVNKEIKDTKQFREWCEESGFIYIDASRICLEFNGQDLIKHTEIKENKK